MYCYIVTIGSLFIRIVFYLNFSLKFCILRTWLVNDGFATTKEISSFAKTLFEYESEPEMTKMVDLQTSTMTLFQIDILSNFFSISVL